MWGGDWEREEIRVQRKNLNNRSDLVFRISDCGLRIVHSCNYTIVSKTQLNCKLSTVRKSEICNPQSEILNGH